jgi:hypothetical protein
VDSFEQWQHGMLEGCKILIEEAKKQESIDVNEPFEVNSTIEIRPVNGNSKEWKMLLSRDSIKCYQKYGEKDRNIYINYAKRVIKEYKQDNSDQLNNPKESRDIPTLYRCEKHFENSTSQCGFYVYESPHCIRKTDTYYAVAKVTEERVITICPHDHDNNEDWVQKEEAWKIVWEVINDIIDSLQLKELPIERIYINFGHRQSQTKNDRLRPRYCHAHTNIVPTKKPIEACVG